MTRTKKNLLPPGRAKPIHARRRLPGHWLLQDAKARFSELVRRVRSEGPQHVTVHGRDEVVVVSAEEFRRLKGERNGDALIAAMQSSPYPDIDIEPKRSADAGARRRPVTGWLLDTNILSELRRPKPEPKVLAFIAAQPLEQLFISTVSLPKSVSASSLLPTPASAPRSTIGSRTRCGRCSRSASLPVTEDIMFKWRLLVEEGRKAGHTFSQPDLIIAATALCHGLTILSRDTRDYERAHAPVVNPWR